MAHMKLRSASGHFISRHAEVSLLLIVGALFLFNQWHMMAIHSLLPNALAAGWDSGGVPVATTGTDVLPHGVPARYGAELGISFDDAASAMPILQKFDSESGTITLTGALQQRYIAIASRTACEFCCGATTLVFPDGKPACACAHSSAMRGVARYLLQKYPQMTDAEILGEVNRWKAAFFPGPTVAKARGGAAGQPTSSSSGALPAQVGGC